MDIHFKTDDEIRMLVEAFEACSFHPSEFRHYQHLTVALWYVRLLDYDDAAERMKTGIRRLAEQYGKTGYHETITLFWVRMVSNFFRKADPEDSLVTTANDLIDNYDKNLVFDYYSKELIESAEAKAAWVEPDLQELES